MLVKAIERSLVVIVVLAPLLVLTLSRLARTELVIGDFVRERVEHEAKRRGADIEILTVSPAGLFGIELEDVAIRVPRGDFAVEADLESVEIYPDVLSMFGDRPTLDEVKVTGGTIGLRPWSRPLEASSDARAEAAPTATIDQPSRPETRPPFAVELHDVDLVAYSALYRTRPLHIENLAMRASTTDGVLDAAGFGKLPDGTAFKIDEAAGVVALIPEKRTHIERWVAPLSGAPWPIAISTTRLRVCGRLPGSGAPPCEVLVELDDLELAAPVWRNDVRVTAPKAAVWRDRRELVLGAPEMAIVDSTTREFSARLTEIDVRYAFDTGRLHGDIQLADVAGGLLDATWNFDSEDFVVDFVATGFDAAAVWHLVPYGEKLRPNQVNGRFGTAYDLRHSTIAVTADLRFDRISAWFPVTKESFDASNFGLVLDAFVDIHGRSLSVPSLRMTFGDAKPIVASATVVHAGDGWAFDARAAAERQDVATLLTHLPRQFAAVTTGAVLRGELGFEVVARGHSAYPDGLVLQGTLDSTVVVEHDAPASDPQRLGRSGAPPQLTDGPWVDWRRLPQHAVDAVLAAEDARFFQHDGFDWRGFERAMIHNLGAGRLARGGSTISQQVAKNLWLTHEKTLARKLEEAYLTWRLEDVQPKRRILEIYLNLADWGPGTRGLEAAAQRYYGVTASKLTTAEVALLAAILPNPARFGGWIEKGHIASSRLDKVEHTLNNLRFMKKITTEEYRRLWGAAKSRGQIGRLTLALCDDDGRAPTGTPNCAAIQ